MSLQSVLDELVAHAEGPRRALPASCYRDPGYWQAELEHVLRPGWHAVGRAHELPDIGDFRAFDLLGEPLLLVRGADRRLRVLSRLCRHRAFPIVEGEGNAKRFTCPYHRWTYELDGRLVAAPLMNQVDDFDLASCALVELPVEEWLGFVLTTLDVDAAPITPALTAIAEVFAPLRLGEYRSVAALEYDSPWNWKVLVENFIESYHHLGPHASSFQKTHPAAGTHVLDLEAAGSVLENPAVEGEAPFWVGHVYPSMLFFAQRGDLPVAAWYEMQVDAVDHFRLRIHVLLPPALAEDPALIDAIVEQVKLVHAEDIEMCDGIQRGIAGRLFVPTRLARQEETLARFHRYLGNRLRRAVQSGAALVP